MTNDASVHGVEPADARELSMPIVPTCWVHDIQMVPVFEDASLQRWRCVVRDCPEEYRRDKPV